MALYLCGLPDKKRQPQPNQVENIGQIPTETYAKQYLTSTPQNYGHQKQEKPEKPSLIKGA